MSVHEDFSRRDEVEGSFNRSFGLVIAAVLFLIGLWPLLGGGTVRLWALVIAALFLLTALARPTLLAPLNRVWMRFGLLLSRMTNPIIMGLLFYVAVTPTALVMRLAGKDPLHRRWNPQAKSYWIMREPPGPPPETMKYQF